MNGKGEWLKFLAGLVLAALVSYFTAIGTLQSRVSVLETRYEQLLYEVREVKGDVKAILYRGPNP